MKPVIIATILLTCHVSGQTVAVAQETAATGDQGSAENQVVRDPQALALVNAVLTMLGGQARVSQIQSTLMEGTSQAIATSADFGQFTWKTMGMDVRREHRGGNGQSLFFAHNGKGKRVSESGEEEQLNSRVAKAFFPFEAPGLVLLHLLMDTDYSLELISDASTVPNSLHLRALQVNARGFFTTITQQDWYIDPQTGLPVRVDFVLPDVNQPDLDRVASILYDSWQAESGVEFPEQVRLLIDGNPQSKMTVTSIQTNRGVDPTAFQER